MKDNTTKNEVFFPRIPTIIDEAYYQSSYVNLFSQCGELSNLDFLKFPTFKEETVEELGEIK